MYSLLSASDGHDKISNLKNDYQQAKLKKKKKNTIRTTRRFRENKCNIIHDETIKKKNNTRYDLHCEINNKKKKKYDKNRTAAINQIRILLVLSYPSKYYEL